MELGSLKLVICLALLAIICVSSVDSSRQRFGRRSRFRRSNRNLYTPRPSNSQPTNDNDHNSQSRDLQTQSKSDDNSSDHSSLLGLYIALCVLAGVIVILLTVMLLVKLCKALTSKARRTSPVAVPVKPAAAPSRPVRQAPIMVARRNQEPDIFTVTPVLPSYADVTKNTVANRPPPVYSVRTSNLQIDDSLSVVSPPPPYAPEEPRNGESRGTSGRRNVQYSRMSSSIDFVLG